MGFKMRQTENMACTLVAQHAAVCPPVQLVRAALGRRLLGHSWQLGEGAAGVPPGLYATPTQGEHKLPDEPVPGAHTARLGTRARAAYAPDGASGEGC